MLRLALLLLPTAASAQLLLEEPFDTAPADGGWTAIAQPVGGVADVTLGRVAGGWRVTHPDAGSGLANRSPCFRKPFDGGVGLVTVRYWLNASSLNDEFGMFPVIIQSPANTLAEVRFTGLPMSAFTPILQCADALGNFHICSSPSNPVLSAQSWHLVELQLEGAGTAQGRCRAAVDGSEFCSQTVNWTGLQPTSAFIGLCALDQVWAGAMTVDELRVSAAPQGSQLRINGPDGGTEGDCLRFTIDTIDAFTHQPTPVAVSTSLEMVTFTGAAGHFASNCSGPALPPVLSPSEPVWEVYARAGRSDIGLTAFSSDLLSPLPLTVHISLASDAGVDAGPGADAGFAAFDAGVDAGSNDAGVDAGSAAFDAGVDAGSNDAGATVMIDAGPNDAGAIDAGQSNAQADAGSDARSVGYDVGCGCTGAPLLHFIAALALLFRSRR